MGARKQTTVIIVNFNGGKHLLRCLGALVHQSVPLQILVVDNASTDDSGRIASDEFPGVRFLPLRRNTGFCRAVNIGVAQLQCNHFILLNPDTIPDHGFVERLMDPFSHDSQIASVAGTLVFTSQPDTIASAGIAVHRNGVALDYRVGEQLNSDASLELIFGASGGAAAFRRDAFVEAGGFPEHFFMYLEDVDLAWRLQLLGWSSVWSPAAIASHAYSSSAGEGSNFKQRLLARNRIWTIVRCTPIDLIQANALPIVLHDLLASGYASIHRNWPIVGGRAEALIRLLPRLCERHTIQRSRNVPVAALEQFLKPSISASELLRLKKLTRELAVEPPMSN